MWLPYSLHPKVISQEQSPSSAEGQCPEVGEVHQDADPGVDFRPHFFDPVSSQFLLCDSGSQVSAFPPDPGDVRVPGMFLKAANGSKMSCYGYKNISIKIGSQNYEFKIIK